MEGAYAKKLYQLEKAGQVLVLRNLLPSRRHVPHGHSAGRRRRHNYPAQQAH